MMINLIAKEMYNIKITDTKKRLKWLGDRIYGINNILLQLKIRLSMSNRIIGIGIVIYRNGYQNQNHNATITKLKIRMEKRAFF